MSTELATDKKAALATAANEARGIAMDSIAAAHSGHMGLPLGAAEIGAVLYGSQVRFTRHVSAPFTSVFVEDTYVGRVLGQVDVSAVERHEMILPDV